MAVREWNVGDRESRSMDPDRLRNDARALLQQLLEAECVLVDFPLDLRTYAEMVAWRQSVLKCLQAEARHRRCVVWLHVEVDCFDQKIEMFRLSRHPGY